MAKSNRKPTNIRCTLWPQLLREIFFRAMKRKKPQEDDDNNEKQKDDDNNEKQSETVKRHAIIHTHNNEHTILCWCFHDLLLHPKHASTRQCRLNQANPLQYSPVATTIVQCQNTQLFTMHALLLTHRHILSLTYTHALSLTNTLSFSVMPHPIRSKSSLWNKEIWRIHYNHRRLR